MYNNNKAMTFVMKYFVYTFFNYSFIYSLFVSVQPFVVKTDILLKTPQQSSIVV